MAVQIQRGLEIVPGYTLVRRVGSGMAGEVWVARASGGVQVAIKIIRDMEMVGSQRELGALRIVREVKHTNLCPLIGVWFFDRDGELLSNAATDEILGQDSSLINTEFLSTKNHESSNLRETHSMNLDDGSTAPRPVDDTDESGFAQTSDFPSLNAAGNASDSAGFGQSARDGSSTDKSHSGESTVNPDVSESLAEARQMVVAMGLGDRTLYDRLIEMRAPDNIPAESDRLHLPGGIPAKELIRYIEGAASAIDELNLKHNIYHCDIKPQNILIVGGNAQVCDFGLARRVHENRRTQLAIGTPAYGAPEMLFDQTYTKTIDQYSLAITYYELRTGKLPFETTRRSTFLRAKAQGELELTRLPAAEQEVIAKASDLEPENRYSNCTEFVEALAAAIDAKPVAPSRLSKRLAISALGIAALAGTASLTFFPRPSSTPVSAVGSSQTNLAVPEPKTLSIETDPGNAANEPDEKQVADISDVANQPSENLQSMKVAPAAAAQSSSTSAVSESTSTERTEPTRTEPKLVEPVTGESVPEGPKPTMTESTNDSLNHSTNDTSVDLDTKAMDSAPLEVEPPKAPSQPEQPPVPTLNDLVEQANQQASQLIALHQQIDDQPPTSSQTKQLNSLIEELDRQRDVPDDANASPLAQSKSIQSVASIQSIKPGSRVTGWELLGRPLRLPSTVIAGQLDWDAGRISDGLRHWISIQSESDLTKAVSVPLRIGVVDRVLPWLIQGTKVGDENTRSLRYADSVSRTAGVLKLANDFAADSDTTLRTIQIEQFLLTASKPDPSLGLKLWDTLRLTRNETSPQLGYALATLVDRQLDRTSQREARIDLAGLRISASQMQRALPDPDRNDSTRNHSNRIQSGPTTDQATSFELLLSLVEFPMSSLPEIPTQLQNESVGAFSADLVRSLTEQPAATGQDVFLTRLDKIERGAAIALVLLKDQRRQQEMRLIASEAFLQTRYEQNDDIPATTILPRLKAYGDPNASQSATEMFVNARIADQVGFLSRDENEVRKNYQRARAMYSSLIADSSAAPDLRGSASRCRAHLLTRLAVIGNEDQKESWLKEAANDAEESLGLPSRWHGDNDDRLMTAAEVNLSMVRLISTLKPFEKQALLEDADQYIAQAIAERKKRSLPSFPHATLRLNGYLLELLELAKSPPGPRLATRRRLAEQWIDSTADQDVQPNVEGVPRTIDSPSSRLRCHWHSMCSMVMSTSSRPDTALAQIQYAHDIAAKKLDPTDDRRHLATLILVQLKSPPLFQSIAAGQKPDPNLIGELKQLLDSIVDPLPDFRAKKEGYEKELAAMAK